MKLTKIYCILILAFTIGGCAQNPNRASCTFFDGVGRTGSFTQYGKGKIKKVYIHVGENIKRVKIICNEDTQKVNISYE